MVRPSAPHSSARSAAIALLLACLGTTPAYALLRFNDGREQVYVTASVSTGWDSNIYTSSQGDNADLMISGNAGIEYARKAGVIGVNATLGWNFGSFSTFTSENFLNPAASLEFSKSTGRTTGAMQLNAARDSRADPTEGLRTESWNYGVNFNYRYPVIERYSFAGNVGWSMVDYVDNSKAFVDLTSYTIGTDLLYSWRWDRDLLAGYRYRTREVTAESQSFDHSYYVGVSGRVVSKLSGSARLGWTTSTTEYPAATTVLNTTQRIEESGNDGVYLSLSATWPVNRKINFALSATQDISTTSTNFQTETTSIDLVGKFSHTVKFNTGASVGGGYVNYVSGFVNDSPVFSPGFRGQNREDLYFTAGLNASYAFGDHYTLSASYTYFRSWSNLAQYAFDRHSVGLSLSTRW